MRPPKDVVFMEVARQMARLSTCIRRAVGCVMVDEDYRVLATACNGVPSKFPHCNEGHPCEGALDAAPGSDNCLGTHAEENAVSQCSDVRRVHTVFCTTLACKRCAGLLLTTSMKRFIFCDEYPSPKTYEMFERRGVQVSRIVFEPDKDPVIYDLDWSAWRFTRLNASFADGAINVVKIKDILTLGGEPFKASVKDPAFFQNFKGPFVGIL